MEEKRPRWITDEELEGMDWMDKQAAQCPNKPPLALRICTYFILCKHNNCTWYKPSHTYAKTVYCTAYRDQISMAPPIEISETPRIGALSVKPEYVKYVKDDPAIIELIDVEENNEENSNTQKQEGPQTLSPKETQNP